MVVNLRVNGANQAVEVEPRWTVADVLRERLGLTGTHLGCEQGVCGACTVLFNGEPVRSCLMFAAQAVGGEITTIEGLDPRFSDSFVRRRVFQCGFCSPGFIVTLNYLLRDGRSYSEDELRQLLSGNVCRCTGYQTIIQAALEYRA